MGTSRSSKFWPLSKVVFDRQRSVGILLLSASDAAHHWISPVWLMVDAVLVLVMALSMYLVRAAFLLRFKGSG